MDSRSALGCTNVSNETSPFRKRKLDQTGRPESGFLAANESSDAHLKSDAAPFVKTHFAAHLIRS